MTQLSYVLPNLGLISVDLYDPADEVYRLLTSFGEVERLQNLSHVGALAPALPGIHRTRWDYTVSMLFFAQRLAGPRLNSRVKLGSVIMSSTHAAVQTLALLWNVGHLPGTFPTEKGVSRYLYSIAPRNPLSALNWPADPSLSQVREAANRVFLEEDPAILARTLAIIKLLRWDLQGSALLGDLARDFLAPFCLRSLRKTSKQWPKVELYFEFVRRVAYLNLDSAMSGMQWGLDFSPALSAKLSSGPQLDVSALEELREILAPFERSVYNSLYYRPEARAAAAEAAFRVQASLQASPTALADIDAWGYASDMAAPLGPAFSPVPLNSVGTMRFRSQFVKPTTPLVAMEKDLGTTANHRPIVLQYHSWNSEALSEPNELIIESFVTNAITPNDVGKLIVWLGDTFDDWTLNQDDSIAVLRALDLQRSYLSLLSRVIPMVMANTDVRFDPWPLKEFGVLPAVTMHPDQGSVWLSSSRLGTKMIKHLLRDRGATVPNRLRESYAELVGLRTLRDYMRRIGSRQRKALKERWLVLTSSIKLVRGNTDFFEFDGGLVHIRTRSGRITFYGLETKSGSENPTSTLQRNLRRRGMNAAVTTLNGDSAFVEIPFTPNFVT